MMTLGFKRRQWLVVPVCLLVLCVSACGGGGIKTAAGSHPAGAPRGGSAANVTAPATVAKLVNGKNKARFVDLGVNPSDGTGQAVDIYLGHVQPISDPEVGGSVATINPKVTKYVSNLAFGSATGYLPVPDFADAYVTIAGSTTIVNDQGEDNEVDVDDDVNAGSPLKNQPLSDTFLIDSEDGSQASQPSPAGSPLRPKVVLTVQQMQEPVDFNQTNGDDLPIPGKAVLIGKMDGLSSVRTSSPNETDERQLGLNGSGSCLPEVNNNAVGGHDSYMSPHSDSDRVEYVTDPGSVTIGIWDTGDEAVCTGTAPASFTAQVTAGQRYYVLGYGPASAAKVLVLPIPAPVSGKTAAPTPQSTD